MKRKAAEIDFDSLIQKMELMNCFNAVDEYKILKESCNIKIENLELREIKDILRKTHIRYKRYLANVDMEGLDEIKRNIYKYIIEYDRRNQVLNWHKRTVKLIDTMIKTDKLIWNEINYNNNNNKYHKIQ